MTSRFRPYLALLMLAIVLGLNFGVDARPRNSQTAPTAAAQQPKPKDSYAKFNGARIHYQSAVLVGHSMGTPVIRQFYRNYPQKTIALVFVDGQLRPFGTPEQQAPLINLFKGPNYKQVAAKFIATLTQNTNPANLPLINSSILGTPQNVLVGGLEAMDDPTIWKDDKINLPALLVVSAGPEWTPEYFQFVQTLVPDLTQQVWTGVSHFLMMDDPPKFNVAVSAFIAGKNLLN